MKHISWEGVCNEKYTHFLCSDINIKNCSNPTTAVHFILNCTADFFCKSDFNIIIPNSKLYLAHCYNNLQIH